MYIESVTFLCGHVVWRTDWRQTALCKVLVSLERRRKWSSPKLSSVQNPVQISVHSPVHSPVHGPVQSPESSFYNDPYLVRYRYAVTRSIVQVSRDRTLASYPGLPMFFNVAREKSGRPGRSGDVIGRGLGRGYVYPAYSPTPFTTWP